jgi:hypothetical protein
MYNHVLYIYMYTEWSIEISLYGAHHSKTRYQRQYSRGIGYSGTLFSGRETWNTNEISAWNKVTSDILRVLCMWQGVWNENLHFTIYQSHANTPKPYARAAVS